MKAIGIVMKDWMKAIGIVLINLVAIFGGLALVVYLFLCIPIWIYDFLIKNGIFTEKFLDRHWKVGYIAEFIIFWVVSRMIIEIMYEHDKIVGKFD